MNSGGFAWKPRAVKNKKPSARIRYNQAWTSEKKSMRFELIIPDTTRPAVKSKLTNLLELLTARPELVEEIHLIGDDETTPVGLTPEQIAKVREAQEDVKAGRVVTLEQSKANLEAHRKEWLAAHPS